MQSSISEHGTPAGPDGDVVDLLAIGQALAAAWKSLVAVPLLAGAMGFGVSFLLPQIYVSKVVFLPPQQQQSAAASALAQLGALSGLAGAAAGLKSPADQYVSLMQSASVADRLIDEFKLQSVYDVTYRYQAREKLARNVSIALGRKDGLITVEAEDESPQRAADLANRHVDELRRLTGQLALTEAQQRRVFFEAQLAKTRDRLTAAQAALQASGFNQGALRADARASAESYARLRAEATSMEVRLQTLRRSFAESTTEVQQALTALGAIRSQLGRLESSSDTAGGPDYIGRYREFKYQETLFELFARQYELARVDESREGALIQVVDPAVPAERPSKPRRLLLAAGSAAGGLLTLLILVVVRFSWRGGHRAPNPHFSA